MGVLRLAVVFEGSVLITALGFKHVKNVHSVLVVRLGMSRLQELTDQLKHTTQHLCKSSHNILRQNKNSGVNLEVGVLSRERGQCAVECSVVGVEWVL